MNIFVLMKQVPGTSNVKMDEKTGTMIRTEHENVINPLDENALEEALRLRQAVPGSNVTAISMGPPPAAGALREALAMGADGAVLLCHRALAGSDTLATARALAGAVKHVAGGDVGSRDLVSVRRTCHRWRDRAGWPDDRRAPRRVLGDVCPEHRAGGR